MGFFRSVRIQIKSLASQQALWLDTRQISAPVAPTVVGEVYGRVPPVCFGSPFELEAGLQDVKIWLFETVEINIG